MCAETGRMFLNPETIELDKQHYAPKKDKTDARLLDELVS